MLKEMVKTADVFCQNARPGAADRNGYGYEDLKVANPDLIYCSISGYGQTGPYARRPACEKLLQHDLCPLCHPAFAHNTIVRACMVASSFGLAMPLLPCRRRSNADTDRVSCDAGWRGSARDG